MAETIKERKEAIKRWFKNPYNLAFLALILIAFILRIWIFVKTMNQPLWWDEATYMATGKKWGLDLNVNDVWYYRRGIFWPLFCAVFFKLGLGEVGIRFAEVLFSTGIVVVSYLMIKDMFGEKPAFLASLALSFSWVFLFFTGRAMTDVPSAFFVLISLLFFWRGFILDKGSKYHYLFGIFFALGASTRLQNLMFIIPLLIYLFIIKRFSMFKNKGFWAALLIFLLVMAPTFILYSLHFENPVVDILARYLHSSPQPGTATYGLLRYFWDISYDLYSPFFVLFLIGVVLFFANFILGIDKINRSEEVKKKLLVFLWIVIPLFSLGYIMKYLSYTEQRYVMAVMPFLFLIAIIPLIKLYEIAVKYFGRKKFLFALLAIILLLLMIPNLSWGKSLTNQKLTSYEEIKEAGLWIKQNSQPQDIVISSSYPQIAYYSERSTFSFENYGNPEDNIMMNSSQFRDFVNEEKPRFLVLSAIQSSPDWAYNYPIENNKTYIPARAYYQGDKPVLVIYERAA